jgi:hypothetical protein
MILNGCHANQFNLCYLDCADFKTTTHMFETKAASAGRADKRRTGNFCTMMTHDRTESSTTEYKPLVNKAQHDQRNQGRTTATRTEQMLKTTTN